MNFGMIEPFKWDAQYVIPVGDAAALQWEGILASRRYGHYNDRGRYTEEFWKSFEAKYVKPLASFPSHQISDTRKCSCSSPFQPVPANELALPVKYEVFTLNDIVDVTKHTYALPAMSTLFRKKLGFVGTDAQTYHMKCGLCKGEFIGIRLDKDNENRHDVAMEALRRAPFSTFSRSLLPFGSKEGMHNLTHAGLPKQEVRFAVNRFARLMHGIGHTVCIAPWTEHNIRNAYSAYNSVFRSGADSILYMLLEMASFSMSSGFPRYPTVEMFRHADTLQKIAKFVARVSSGEYEEFSKLPGNKQYTFTPSHKKFETLVSFVANDVDYDLTRSFLGD